MDNNYQPYARVDSLYGPGTVGAWLLTVLSVFIGWTLNKNSREKDTISIDFLAVLILPTVAVGHLFYLVAHLPTTIAEVLTAEDIDSIQRLAAIEAPLNICETFAIVALMLAACCGPFYASGPKWKRLGLILLVGLLSWATEEYLFQQATRRGVRAANTMLSRTYVFLVVPIVGSVWAFIGVCLMIALIFAFVTLIRWLKRRSNNAESSGGDHEIPMRPPTSANEVVIDEIYPVTHAEQEQRQIRHESIMMRVMASVTLLYLPTTFLALLMSNYTMKTKSQTLNQNLGQSREPTELFFIPKSSGSLFNLDQALAMATGLLVVIYSARAACVSRKHATASN
jgi:hypothetical protein